MTDVTAEADRPDTIFTPRDPDPITQGGFDARADAADLRWFKFGIAAALGVVAGTVLFATEAHGRSAGRTERRDGRR